MVAPSERQPLPPPGARVSVPTFGLDGVLLPPDLNTFVNFLAPKPTVLSQRVEEPAQVANTSRKRALPIPTSEPPNDQRQVERMNHLWETRLTEQVVTHRRNRHVHTTQMSTALAHFDRPLSPQNGVSSKTTPHFTELPLSRIKRIMKEDSCYDALVLASMLAP